MSILATSILVLFLFSFGLIWHDGSARPLSKRSNRDLGDDDKRQNKQDH
jgi:hypothetical protein